jgi:inhibitor of KinA sporulation pathway (predicted exonuclease)
MLLQEYKCFPNPVVWGGGDAHLFKKEAKEKFGYCKVFGHREIDLKTIHSFFQMAKNEKLNSSLKSTLASYKLNFIGTQHRAVDDARNTLNLFFAMILKQKAIYNLINEASKLK